MALKRGSGSGAGGALIVAALPPVAGQAVGAQFWLEEEETLWRVEEYEVAAADVPASITKTPLVQADFGSSTINGNQPVWAGALGAAPAAIAGSAVIFWDTTSGHGLGAGSANGEPLKYVNPAGTISAYMFSYSTFISNYGDGVQWIGNSDALSTGANAFQYGGDDDDTEAEIITRIEANATLLSRIGDPDWLNIYFDEDEGTIVRITDYTPFQSAERSITKVALSDADFRNNGSGSGTTLDYVGALSALPATPAGTVQTWYWDNTVGAVIGDGLNQGGTRLKVAAAGSNNGSRAGLQSAWFAGNLSAAELIWIGEAEQDGASNTSYGDDTLETEDDILEFLDANSEVKDLIGVGNNLVLFQILGDNIYKITAHSAGVSGTKALRYTQLAAGSGGGSPLVTTMKTVLGEPEEIWSGDIAAATADTYVFVTDDDSNRVILPDDADIAFVVIDHGSEDAGEPPVGTTHWIPIEVFNALTAAAALTATNQVTTSDFFRGTATGSFTRRDFSWGITALRELVFTSDSSAESIVGGSISIVRRFSVIATAEGGGGGGGAGHSGYIAPKDEYDADDLGKRVWENGIDKVVELFTQAGHSRVVVFQDLANAASALNADGTNVTTGVAGEFLGIFANLSAVPALSVTDGSWAGFVGSGDFEIQDPTGFYSSEHWNSYNPFRGSGMRPWSTITLADATTLDHVPFTDPDTGIVSDWRIVNSSGHAERYTTAVGEAFFVQNERLIRMVIEFTEHADDEVRYRAVPYRPPGVDPSIHGSANVAIGLAEANQMIDTTLQVPLAPWFFFNLGPAGDNAIENGEWHRVNTAQLNAKDDVVASEVPEAANSLKFNNIAVSDDVDVWLGKDADENLYIAMTAVSDDPMPFAIAV